MTTTRVHQVSVVRLGQEFFWKCSCGASANRGAPSEQQARKLVHNHKRK